MAQSLETGADSAELDDGLASLGWDDEDQEGDEDDIPDWMKEAGWGPSTGAFDESQSAFEIEDEPDEWADETEAVAGDVPDWLKQMAPPGALDADSEEESATEQPPTPVAESDIDLPDWLSDKPDEASDTIITWLDKSAPEATIPTEDPVTQESEPDWLAGLGEADDEADDLDWLSEADESADDLPAVEAGAAAVAGIAALSEEESDADLPDWLSEMEASGEQAEPPPAWLSDISEESVESEADAAWDRHPGTSRSRKSPEQSASVERP